MLVLEISGHMSSQLSKARDLLIQRVADGKRLHSVEMKHNADTPETHLCQRYSTRPAGDYTKLLPVNDEPTGVNRNRGHFGFWGVGFESIQNDRDLMDEGLRGHSHHNRTTVDGPV